jgi:hypothetical protein
MTYETWISIEMAGIRRGIRMVFEYHIKEINGKPQLLHDSVTALCGEERRSGEFFYDFLGLRQRKELEDRLLDHWKAENRKAA